MSKENKNDPFKQTDVMAIIFDYARWLNKYGWKIDSEDWFWFRECEDGLTPDISFEYTDEMVWNIFLKQCYNVLWYEKLRIKW